MNENEEMREHETIDNTLSLCRQLDEESYEFHDFPQMKVR